MKGIGRDELIGNILKIVNIRFDYMDIFEVKADVLNEIKAETKFEVMPTKLTEFDFALNDPVLPPNNVPIDYLTGLRSYDFFDKDTAITLTINQLYCSIVQDTQKGKYLGFENLYQIIEKVVKILQKYYQIKLCRIGIRKVDEYFLLLLMSLTFFFEPQILNFFKFEPFIKFGNESSESKVIQRFDYNDYQVNFVRLFDNGILDQQKVYRLYLDYDVYDKITDRVNGDFDQSIVVMNDILYELFQASVTQKTLELLKSGETIGRNLYG